MPNRTAPLRPVSRPRATATPTPKLPDFTEDPFRDYRYEDPFQIADPFGDEDDSNANKITQGKSTNNENRKLDPFGMETTSGYSISDKDTFEKGFESDFLKTSPLLKTKTDKMGNFITDTKNNSLKTTNEIDFTNNSITAIPRPVSKPVNFDEAFSTKKMEKSNSRSDRNIAQVFKDMLTTHDNSHKNKNNNSNATWSNRKDTSAMLSEREQLAWASRQSLRAEEERCRRAAQEDADYALALELSKQDNSNKF